MRKQARGPQPDCLAEWEQLGIAWEAKRAAKSAENKTASWDWGRVGGKPIDKLLLECLRTQAGNHCSFCDAFPVSPPSNDTIEHVKPKSEYPREAWKWSNLFYCCVFCQTRKGSKWKPALLVPDAEDYAFSRYFFPDHTNGKLEIKPGLAPEDEERARNTLEIYGLNHPGHLPLRLRTLEHRSMLRERPLDEFAYRDFIEA